jgi:hypothetical protein
MTIAFEAEIKALSGLDPSSAFVVGARRAGIGQPCVPDEIAVIEADLASACDYGARL